MQTNFSVSYDTNDNINKFLYDFLNNQRLNIKEHHENFLMYQEDILLIMKENEDNECSMMNIEDERYHELNEPILLLSHDIFKNYLYGDFKLCLYKQFNEYNIKVMGIYSEQVCSTCGNNPNCIGSEWCRGSIYYYGIHDIKNICNFDFIKNQKQLYFIFSKFMYILLLKSIKEYNINYNVDYNNYQNKLELFTKQVSDFNLSVFKNFIKKLNKLNYDVIIYLLDFII
jgi:hypothetical protein